MGEENKKPKIGPDKILTISAEAYCAMNGTQIKDYRCVGVHIEHFVKPMADWGKLGLEGAFLEKVPDNADVVVNYFPYGTGASGTALISNERFPLPEI